AAAHPLEPAQDVLQRVVECVPHVERASDVGRRNDNGVGLGVAPLGPASLEGARLLPQPGNALLDLRGLVGFLDHRKVGVTGKGLKEPSCRALVNSHGSKQTQNVANGALSETSFRK